VAIRNHRIETELLIEKQLNIATHSDQRFGFLLRLIGISMPNGTTEHGWNVIITMKNPLIGKGELFAKMDVPVIVIPTEIATKVINEAVEGLRNLGEKVKQEALEAGTGPNGAH
jgi:hypothetical protein